MSLILIVLRFLCHRLMSLTMLTLDFELVQPELVVSIDGKSLVDIEKGKHILQELCMDTGTFNANSASFGVDRCQRISIITGPNSSGKSVYLKVIQNCNSLSSYLIIVTYNGKCNSC